MSSTTFEIYIYVCTTVTLYTMIVAWRVCDGSFVSKSCRHWFFYVPNNIPNIHFVYCCVDCQTHVLPIVATLDVPTGTHERVMVKELPTLYIAASKVKNTCASNCFQVMVKVKELPVRHPDTPNRKLECLCGSTYQLPAAQHEYTLKSELLEKSVRSSLLQNFIHFPSWKTLVSFLLIWKNIQTSDIRHTGSRICPEKCEITFAILRVFGIWYRSIWYLVSEYLVFGCMQQDRGWRSNSLERQPYIEQI